MADVQSLQPFHGIRDEASCPCLSFSSLRLRAITLFSDVEKNEQMREHYMRFFVNVHNAANWQRDLSFICFSSHGGDMSLFFSFLLLNIANLQF